MRALAQELVGLQPNIILAGSTPATAAVQRETRMIPIVFAGVGDPVGSGLVAALNQPGGNITGFADFEASVEPQCRCDRGGRRRRLRGAVTMAKTLNDHIADIRSERAAQLEREIEAEAASRMAADQERERLASVAAEVNLPADAPAAEVARRHNKWEADFWTSFVNSDTPSADKRFRALATALGFDPMRTERHEVFVELCKRKIHCSRRPPSTLDSLRHRRAPCHLVSLKVRQRISQRVWRRCRHSSRELSVLGLFRRRQR
jgi:hypothetical protein